MRKIWRVVIREICTTMGKPSFWLVTVVFPLVFFGFSLGSQLLSMKIVEGEVTLPGDDPSAPKPLGYVDAAGVIEHFPESLSSDDWQQFATTSAAEAALQGGEVDNYYIIPEDFMETGDVRLIQKEFSPFAVLASSNFRRIIKYNLAQDAEIARHIDQPLAGLTSHQLDPSLEAAPEQTLTPEEEEALEALPLLILFIFFFIIMMTSSLMLSSVSKEKVNRVVEVLLLSLDPRDLMIGKLIGLGIVALVEIVIWLGISLVITRQQPPWLGIASTVVSNLPSGFLALALLYFLLGYLTYASLMGALGALAPSAKETGQFMLLIMSPLLLTTVMMPAIAENPDGVLAMVFSLFPLTSSASMMSRLAAASVPPWQILLSLGLLILSTYGFLALAARFFRADTLLSTMSLNWKRVRSILTSAR